MSGISGKTRVVGVWGHPVGHSRSPAMHNAALAALGLDWAYLPFDVAPDDVVAATAGIRALGLVGVNITVPLKERVLPFLDVVSEAALWIGSVNTIHNRDGKLYGDSTDGPGFLRSLEEAGQPAQGRKVLLLGAGGSARAIGFALAAAGSHCKIVNRTEARARSLTTDINARFPGLASMAGWGAEAGEFDLLVNTTSVGMSPQEGVTPALPPQPFAGHPFVYDLIYAPPQTRLLAAAERAGCETMNGVPMLVHQGALSLALWTGRAVEEIPVAVMEQAVLASLKESGK